MTARRPEPSGALMLTQWQFDRIRTGFQEQAPEHVATLDADLAAGRIRIIAGDIPRPRPLPPGAPNRAQRRAEKRRGRT